ncbi:MAG: NAD(P)/FAD-dependent oxidoreductase [Myxococcota bacterium]
MHNADNDILVIGSGPNGLVAACVLARAGMKVTVLEANPRRAGGALGSEQATLPGFIHDVGAGFFPFGKTSPAFQSLDLVGHGLSWLHMELESCHPAPDGTVACISRDHEVSARHFGSPEDGAAWRKLARWHGSVEKDILGALLGPFPAVMPMLRLLPVDLLKLAIIAMSSGRGLSTRLFRTEAARRVLPGLALHVDVGPDDRFGAALGYMLGLTATTGGYPVPKGGAQALTDALVSLLRAHGGEVKLGARVERIVVAQGRAHAVELAGGEELVARRAILANTSAESLFLDLLDRHLVPGFVQRRMKHFPHGWGTFKVDWALSAPVPWSEELARRSAVVHAGDSLDDLSRFTRQVRSGQLPDNPYLVVGQQSLMDPSRAPPGQHTLWAYSRVPSSVEGGWDAHKEAFADRVDARIERLAPGFRRHILARRVVAPVDLQVMDANLLGGDIGGGSNAWHRQLLFRPVFPYFRYRTPVAGLYLCSSYAHPGAGVHGMCGFNAAHQVLRDV